MCACGEPALSAASVIPAGNDQPRPCANCGYDLRGLTAPRCPECGTMIRRRRGRLMRGGEPASMKRAWLTALWTFGAGVAACVLVTLVGDDGGLEKVPTMLLRLGAQVMLLWVVFSMFAVMWSGVDDDWMITLVRLAAVAAIGGFVGLLMNFLPVFTFGLATLGFVLVVALLLWNWMEMEPGDAFLIAGLAGITRVVVFFSLFMK